MKHELKTWLEVFKATKTGLKTADFRKNDRNYVVGDTLILKEYDKLNEEFTGAFIKVEITHIVKGPHFGIPEGYALLSFNKYND